jgi:hypothetical protein
VSAKLTDVGYERFYTTSVKNQRFLPASPQGEALGALGKTIGIE